MDQCQTKDVFYQATVLSKGNKNETNIGLTAWTFKKRVDGHTSNFRDESSKGTTLSSNIWKLKNHGTVQKVAQCQGLPTEAGALLPPSPLGFPVLHIHTQIIMPLQDLIMYDLIVTYIDFQSFPD